MYAAIAQFLNSFYHAFVAVASLFGGGTAPAPAGSSSGAVVSAPAPSNTTGPATSVPAAATSKRCQITKPERISARFDDTGSSAWSNQPGGKHLGTDFAAPMGSPVYAAYAMHIIAIGHYTDAGRYGDYVMGSLADGAEYYSGHLQNVRVKVGDYVACGQQIGETTTVNHTHIQLRVGGVLTDFEEYQKAH